MSESKGIMKDMKVYRDGDKDGVVFEYIYSKGVEVDASQLSDAKIKGTMLPQLRGDKNAKYAMNMGIYVKILYKSADGKVYGETTISKDDL